MYRKTVLFLASFKTFLGLFVVTASAVILGITNPDNDILGIIGVFGLMTFVVYFLLIVQLGDSVNRAIRLEELQEKERHNDKVVAEHEAFINEVAERVSNIYDETIDAIDEDVSNDDASIIIMEIYRRGPLMETSDEK